MGIESFLRRDLAREINLQHFFFLTYGGSSGLGIVSACWEGSDADGLRLAFVGGLSRSIVQSVVQRRVRSRIQTIRKSRGRCAGILGLLSDQDRARGHIVEIEMDAAP